MKTVKKRDNRIVEFDREKIVSAIQRAFIEVDGTLSDSTKKIANFIADGIASSPDDSLSVEEIQDRVIYALMDTKYKEVVWSLQLSARSICNGWPRSARMNTTST